MQDVDISCSWMYFDVCTLSMGCPAFMHAYMHSCMHSQISQKEENFHVIYTANKPLLLIMSLCMNRRIGDYNFKVVFMIPLENYVSLNLL